MKLISCHIENFGQLQNKDYAFNDNLTCIYENNGAGKTTLAAFIKAMFYGLESTKKQTKILGIAFIIILFLMENLADI